MLLPLIGGRLRRRDAGDHGMGPSFMGDRRPPPAEEYDHVGQWLASSGMIDVRDHEKDTSLGGRRTAKWHERSRQCT
jgi:hypothetical protein